MILNGISVLGHTVSVNEDKNVNTLFAGGSGTDEDPYQISNVTQLQNMNEDLSAHYELVNDIDANETRDWNDGKGFAVVGTRQNIFRGNLDGKGYRIFGLWINRTNSGYVGLLGHLHQTASVKGIGLIDANVKGWIDVGMLVGENSGTVNNSYSIGNVSGNSKVGGLVGENGGTISNSYAAGNVSGNTMVGGLVGLSFGTLNNSHYNLNEVLINGEHHITRGALYKSQYKDWISNDKNLDISDYQSTLVPSKDYYLLDNVQGIKNMLGFVDKEEYKFRFSSDIDLSNEPGLYLPYLSADLDGDGHTIKNLHLNFSTRDPGGFIGILEEKTSVMNLGIVDANVSGYCPVALFVGVNAGTVSNSFANGIVNGNEDVGGLVGSNSGTVKKSYTSGIVNGSLHVGGLVGWNFASINNSHAINAVKGIEDVGGLVGVNIGTLRNTYAVGNVSGSTDVGGLVGVKHGYDSTVNNSFWDVDTTGQSSSEGGTGKTTSMMKNISTFTDTLTEGLNEPWDFFGNSNDDDGNEDIWSINENVNNGYPYLSRSFDTIPPEADAGEDKTVSINEEIFFDGSKSSDNTGISNYKWTISFNFTNEDGYPWPEDHWSGKLWGGEFTGKNFTFNFTHVGSYKVTLNVTDYSGNQDTDTITVDVVDKTKPVASAGSDKTVGLDEEVVFNGSGSSDNGFIEKYMWNIEGNEYSREEVTHSFSEVGTYDVTLTVKDTARNSDSDTITVKVEDNIDPIVSVDIYGEPIAGEELTLDASESSDNVGIESIEWEFGDGATATGANVTHTYSEAGDYTVNVTINDEAGNVDEYQETITVEEEYGGDDDTPGFTLIVLMFNLALVAIYRYRKR
ncbi:MAG: PKD domain-containing protein [Thermoplasmatota archaeon]